MISRQHLTYSYVVLALVVFFLPPVAVFSGLAVAPFVIIFLAVAVLEGLLKRALIIPFNGFVVCVLLLAGWCLAASFWAYNLDQALTEWAIFALVVLLGVMATGVLHHLQRKQLENIRLLLSVAMPLMLLLVAVELLFYGQILYFFREQVFQRPTQYFNPELYNRGACFLAVFFWALVVAHSKTLQAKTPLALALFALLSVACIISLGRLESLSARVAFVMASCVFLFVLLAPRMGMRILQIGILLLAVLIPLFALKLAPKQVENSLIPASAVHRLYIWHFSATKALEEPWLGHGFYSSRDIPGGKQVIALNGQSSPLGWVQLPNHSHNAVLQMWLECGAVGIILYIMLGLLALQWVHTKVQHPLQKACFAAMMVSYFTISCLAFNMWQEWWVSTGIFAFILMRLYVYGFIDLPPSVRGGRMLLN